jgi:hypothetical protein
VLFESLRGTGIILNKNTGNIKKIEVSHWAVKKEPFNWSETYQ